MRIRRQNARLSVHAIAGTEVVLLGLNAAEEAAKGLIGFTIYKRKGVTGRFTPLPSGGRSFLGEQEEQADSRKVDSKSNPIQAFMWSDYKVDRGNTYTYKIVPVYGTPESLHHDTRHAVEVKVTTEDPAKQKHGVYFNRGVAGSLSYARRFGKHRKWYLDASVSEFLMRPFARPFVKPGDVPDRAAYKWLSRGLEEAILDFIGQAKRGDKLRAAVYELTYDRVIEALVAALERGVDVQVVHHAKREKALFLKQARKKQGAPKPARPVTTTVWTGTGPIPDDAMTNPSKRYMVEVTTKDAVAMAADRAVARIGLTTPDSSRKFQRLLKALDKLLVERTNTTISHNKFIVLLKKKGNRHEPTQVWTGSTNFTEGGIFGQSNVGHVVRDKNVARAYLAFWNQLSKDPTKADLKEWTVRRQADLTGPPPPGIITVFSPRKTKRMLDWYAGRLDAAKRSVFFTAAFSVSREFFDVLKKVKKVDGQPYEGTPYLRYLALEGTGGHLEAKFPELQACPQNRIAWGDILKRRRDEEPHQQFIETLTGLNSHVNYLHTKYMLVDPLSDDPLVISGSANFSTASTKDNDENMLVIQGNKRVADIFLTEFMRLFNHFETRNRLNALTDAQLRDARRLAPDDKWTIPYYDSKRQEYQERLLFA